VTWAQYRSMSTATLPARRPIVVPPKPERTRLTRVRGMVLFRRTLLTPQITESATQSERR
jgi:hypothetical protein